MNEPLAFPDPELDALLGAFALDAVDGDELDRVTRYVEANPAAQRELGRFEDVLAALATADAAEAPPELWAGVASRLRPAAELRRQAAPVPRPPVTHVEGPDRDEPDRDEPDRTGSVDELAARRARRGAVVRRLVAAAAVVLVAAGSLALGRAIGGDGGGVPTVEQLAASAATAPGHRVAVLNGTAGSARLIVDGGLGYLVADGLATLEPTQTYQLWSLDGDAPVSLAVLGNRPGTIAIPSGTVQQVAISVERAGGSTAPTLPPVAVGRLTA